MLQNINLDKNTGWRGCMTKYYEFVITVLQAFGFFFSPVCIYYIVQSWIKKPDMK